MTLAAPPALGACNAPKCSGVLGGEWPAAVSLAGSWRYHPASLIGADAYRPGLDDRAWPEMQVPSNWFLEGLDRSGAVWFRRSFDTPANAGRRTLIVFDGVDYAADVWLNGHYLGFHEGYFERFAFEAGPWLRAGEPNVLAVRVDSPLEQGSSWSLHKRLIKGVFAHHDARPGNAWSDRGQEQNTGGIWGAVWLKPAGDVSLDDIRVRPDAVTPTGEALIDGGTARLTAAMTLVNASSSTSRVRVRITVSPHNFMPGAASTVTTSLAVELRAGSTTLPISVDVPNASRWWMWEHGHPNLYRLGIVISDVNGAVEAASRVFGFRSIAFNESSGEWRLNGRRIFIRGTNYIASQWLSEMTADAYRRDLALMKQAGINAIRVHAHVEGEELYRQADENGLLIWQDFPLQWGYVDDEAFQAEAARQAIAMVDQLGHHPSVAVWSAHNEPPWDATWMKDKYPDYSPEQNRALDRRLDRAMSTRDPSRTVHMASTTVEHPWYGWYSGVWSDYAKPTKQPLITEFGAQALPGLAALRQFIPERELWPGTPEEWARWEYHDFQPRETFKLAQIERGSSIVELIDNTQRYQAQLVKFAAEAYRRQKYAPVGGVFQFMFNECWPSANWGIVDYWRKPKAGFDALAIAYQPVLPSIEWTPGTLTPDRPVTARLWVINDLWRAFPSSTLEWTLRSSTAIVDSGIHAVTVQPDSAIEIVSVSRRLAHGSYTLVVTLKDAANRVLGHNDWSFIVKDPS
jgi:beta-mannosidase